MSFENIILLLAIILAFIVSFAAGTNDEMMAPGVASKVFSLRTAVVLGAIFSLLGALIGQRVAETIGKGIILESYLSKLTDVMVISILISMVVWLVITSVTEGLPISTTQSVVGAIIGVALLAWGELSIDYLTVVGIILGWVLSPILGFIVAATFHLWILRFEESLSTISDYEQRQVWYGRFLGLFLIISTASRAGNDVANSIAPVLGMRILEGQDFSWLLFVGGIGMGVGLILIGWKVIKIVAMEIVSMTPASALSAMISVSVVMTLGTLLGFPLSGTHVLVAAMIAVGWAERSKVRSEMVTKIFVSWIITVPISALLSAALFLGFSVMLAVI